jgi:hypothetical protein
VIILSSGCAVSGAGARPVGRTRLTCAVYVQLYARWSGALGWARPTRLCLSLCWRACTLSTRVHVLHPRYIKRGKNRYLPNTHAHAGRQAVPSHRALVYIVAMGVFLRALQYTRMYWWFDALGTHLGLAFDSNNVIIIMMMCTLISLCVLVFFCLSHLFYLSLVFILQKKCIFTFAFKQFVK